ncbi:MAG: hypothetical protein JWM02_2484 [Frankiales bacterium]|nr:hypothetical protein [Frankiales bacterium]
MKGLSRVLRPRARRVDVLVAVLLLLLGFGLAVQVRSTQSDGLLASARQEDLVQILDELSNRGDRLRQEVTSLTQTKSRLTSGSGAAEAALTEARRRTQLLGVIAGTVAATGPGVLVRITDPKTQVSASVLLDALEELRNAGAEAVQLEGTGAAGAVVAVRVVAQSSLSDDPQGVVVDGTKLVAPYRFVVVGDPSTLSGAMAIPGGVEDAVHQLDGNTVVTRAQHVRVGALRALVAPRYARPSPN